MLKESIQSSLVNYSGEPLEHALKYVLWGLREDAGDAVGRREIASLLELDNVLASNKTSLKTLRDEKRCTIRAFRWCGYHCRKG
jgi:hypothetical protein